MKFTFIHPVTSPVPTYQGRMVSTGDIVEFDEYFSAKAMNNPHYSAYTEKAPEIASEGPQVAADTPKKRGRKHGN